MLDLDDIIEKSLKSEADKLTIPPKEEVWAQITGQLEKQRVNTQKKRRAFKLAVASIVLILSFGTVLLTFPERDATAVGQRLVQIMQSIFGGETRIETISRETLPPANEPAPPGDEAPVETIQVPEPMVFNSVDEARKVVPFDFRVPKYVPEGYQLEEITYMNFEKKTGEVVLRYESENSELKIIERILPGDFAMSSIVRTQEVTVHEVNVNGNKGTMMSFKNGQNELEYYSSGISIRIFGKVDTKEILKIAESLQ